MLCSTCCCFPFHLGARVVTVNSTSQDRMQDRCARARLVVAGGFLVAEDKYRGGAASFVRGSWLFSCAGSLRSCLRAHPSGLW